MHSWIFRNLPRLETVYGPRWRPEDRPPAPLDSTEDGAQDDGSPATAEPLVVLRPALPRRHAGEAPGDDRGPGRRAA